MLQTRPPTADFNFAESKGHSGRFFWCNPRTRYQRRALGAALQSFVPVGQHQPINTQM